VVEAGAEKRSSRAPSLLVLKIWSQEHYREYIVLSYQVRQVKWLFDAWYGRAKEGECSCVTARKIAVTQNA
jgi:hypothetical protein